jgi:hypothetical protein
VRVALRRAISYLRGMPVPGVDGFSFDDVLESHGEDVHVEVIRAFDGRSAGTAVGKRADDLIEHAQRIARMDAEA